MMNTYASSDAIACLRQGWHSGHAPAHRDCTRPVSAPVHLSADQIWAKVLEAFARRLRATVYNTLRLFSEKKMIRELFVDPQRGVRLHDRAAPPPLQHRQRRGARHLGRRVARDRPARLPAGVVLDAIDVIKACATAKPADPASFRGRDRGVGNQRSAWAWNSAPRRFVRPGPDA